MGEMIKMVVVLTILSTFSGGLLAAIQENTVEQIENQQLAFVKGPAIKAILEGSENDPITDRFKLMDGDVERSFFVGVFNGKPNAVCLEGAGKGYGGPLGVMVGVDLEEGSLKGIGMTTHAETPGIGALAATNEAFKAQFGGMPMADEFKYTGDGGQVDALSGATITTRAVAAAVTDATQAFQRLKPQIEERLKTFAK